MTVRDQVNYLPTTLCRIATLPKNFTKDAFKMKKLQGCKLNNPDQRYVRINKLVATFQQTQVLDQFGMKINPNFANVKAK